MIVGVGAGCSRLQLNDEVWADVGYSGLLPGAHGNGAWAEYVTVAEEIVSRKPTSMPHSMAGALPLVALTAYQSMATAGAPWDANSNISVVITSGDGGTGNSPTLQPPRYPPALYTLFTTTPPSPPHPPTPPPPTRLSPCL